MGKRARRRRTEEKRLARWFGIKEDEFGRLRKTMTKAEARRQLVAAAVWRRKIEYELVDLAVRQATEAICAEEDARVFGDLQRSIDCWAECQLAGGFTEGSYDG